MKGKKSKGSAHRVKKTPKKLKTPFGRTNDQLPTPNPKGTAGMAMINGKMMSAAQVRKMRGY